jgi:ABC-type glycerol-3-phosphate transport system substrate-binding protein
MAGRMAIMAGALLLGALAGPSAATESAYGQLTAVPDTMLGSWKMTGERCEEGETPTTKAVDAQIRFEPDFTYELTVEGWASRGRYRIDRFRDAPLRIQLAETLYEFDLVGDRLENWSEGEAVYLCGRIFERAGSEG